MPHKHATKKADKSNATADVEPTKGPLKSTLKGMTFDQGADALSPDKGEKGKSKGGLSAIKSALGFGKKDKPKGTPPPPERIRALASIMGHAQSGWQVATNIATRAPQEMQKLKGSPDSQSVIAALGRAQSACSKINSEWQKLLVATGDYTQNGGDDTKIKGPLASFAGACADLHKALYGHVGPADYVTADGILAKPDREDLVGGRTKSTAEKGSGAVDGRKGEKQAITQPQLSTENSHVGAATIRNSVGSWVTHYGNFMSELWPILQGQYG